MPSMRSSRVRVTTLLALLTIAISATAGASADTATDATTRDVDTCRALGFDADVLDCRRCEDLTRFLSDKLSTDNNSDKKNKKKQASHALDADCRKCCTDLSAVGSGGAGAQQYDRVVLEVCTCKFGRYPKVANFVHYHADEHAKLEIKYINARHPFLIFYDAEGNKKEEIAISSWDEDTISEFIVAKIKSDDESVVAPAEEESPIEGESEDAVQGEETTAGGEADAESTSISSSSTTSEEEVSESVEDVEDQEEPQAQEPGTENDEL